MSSGMEDPSVTSGTNSDGGVGGGGNSSDSSAAYRTLSRSISRSAEANERRITQIEKAFGGTGQTLHAPGRFLIGEGVLTKACRKKLKPRQFFLFNDVLVYGSIMVGSRRRFNKQRVIPLEEVKMQSLEDVGQFRHGWVISTLGKSFAVYAATAAEKAEWMGHLEKCSRELIKQGVKTPPAEQERAAVWVQDDEAARCMVCKKTQFTIVNRRHHCRKCGAVVCAACSPHKQVISHVSDKPLRVCKVCAGQEKEEGENEKEAEKSDGEQKQKQKAVLVRQNHTSQEAGDAEDDRGDTKTPPPRPPPPQLFPDSDDPYKKIVVPEREEGDDKVPEVTMPKRNPKLYQLVTMEGLDSGSFWWDSVDANEDPDFGAGGTFDSSISTTVAYDDEGDFAAQQDGDLTPTDERLEERRSSDSSTDDSKDEQRPPLKPAEASEILRWSASHEGPFDEITKDDEVKGQPAVGVNGNEGGAPPKEDNVRKAAAEE